ncbi:DUF2931 family protein, partial [Maribacter sp.]|nr:DUF2931 family protein [Maribacter sp.]
SFDLATQKMAELFKTGAIDNRGILEPFNRIKVGLGPKGIVSVWISNAGFTTEVGYFQATETKMTMKAFHPGGVPTLEEYMSITESFSPEVKEIIKEGVADSIKDKWNGYREKYVWIPRFESEKESTSHDVFIRYFNGEHIYTTASNPSLTSYEYRAVPKETNLHWSEQNGSSYKANILFDENEIFKAFEAITEKGTSSKLDVVFRVDKYNSTIKIYLDNGTKRIALEASKIKAFPTN